MPSAEFELRGHIIDSYILPRVWGTIEDAGATFHVREMRIGQSEIEPSYTRLEVTAENDERLSDLMRELAQLGAQPVVERDARTAPVLQPGVLPDDFYSTTNLPTQVRVDSHWLPVEQIEMDVAVVVERTEGRARACPMHMAQVGDEIVVGYEGVRVEPLERPRREREAFGFMQSPVSSERAKALAIREVADAMRAARAHRGKILLVLGPAVVHTAARQSVARLIRMGYVQTIFAGNALAAHDVEAAMFGTSLGISLETGEPVEHGHRNHLRAINAVRAAGSFAAARERGLLERWYSSGRAGTRRRTGAGWVHPRRRPDAGCHYRRRGGPGTHARGSARHRGRHSGRLNAARHRHRQHATRGRADRRRRYQSGRRHQSGRSGTAQALGLVTDVELFLSALVVALDTAHLPE